MKDLGKNGNGEFTKRATPHFCLLISADIHGVDRLHKVKYLLYFVHYSKSSNSNSWVLRIIHILVLQLCIGKRRCIQLCSLHEDRVSFLRELSTPEPVNVAMDGNYVCVAGQGQYSVFNVESGTRQDLFPYDAATTYPHVKRIAKVELTCGGLSCLKM